MTGKRSAQPVYSVIAIEITLALRLLFHLTLMSWTLPCPEHTTFSTTPCHGGGQAAGRACASETDIPHRR
jgi:hypothetical protein